MKNGDKATRLTVVRFPEDIERELAVLSEFNAVSKTDFVVLSLKLIMESLYERYPELASLPSVPLRKRSNRRKNTYEQEEGDDEGGLMAAEDDGED